MLTLSFREQAGGLAHRAQHLGMRVLAPLQSGSSQVLKPFRDAWNWVGDLFHAKSETKALRKEVAALRQETAHDLMLREENERLQALLRLEYDGSYPDGTTFVTARVIARATEAWYSTATINAGSEAGVALYDAVVNEQGLVGRVTDVTTDAARVTLLTDQDSYVDAMVEPGGAKGVVAGDVNGNVSMLYVDKSAKVEAGQFVLTSGMKGSIFVRGIPIGVIDNVGKQEVQLYQSITVKPLVDFHNLDFLLVVKKP